MLNKRGISPLIATILLVALVIAIALIVWFWYANYLQNQADKLGRRAIAEGECVLEVDFKIESASCFDKNNDGTKDNVLISLRNEGKVNIADFRVRIYGTGGSQVILAGQDLQETHATQTSVQFDPAKVGIPQRIEVLPVVSAEGTVKTCTNKVALVPLTNC